MKTIVTITFVLFIGMTTQAHDVKNDKKIVIVEMTSMASTSKEFKCRYKTDVVRLIRYKNAKVKKALQFLTKWDNDKLA